jgi:regulator of cell morphogenesis and NO signaling
MAITVNRLASQLSYVERPRCDTPSGTGQRASVMGTHRTEPQAAPSATRRERRSGDPGGKHMNTDTLAEALEHEHHEIDSGIGAFLADPQQTAALGRALAALRRHIYLEEQFLFPPLYEAGEVPSIVLMVREHGAIWRTMDAIDASLDAGTKTHTTELCHELLGQLERHNAIEESVIYPEADSVLTPHAAEALRSFLEAGHTPEGWVCQGVSRRPAQRRGPS